jgi:plastocyanin
MRSHVIRFGFVAAITSAALWGGSGMAAAGAGCHASDMTTGRGSTVELSEMCFDATVLYVEPGTEVTWTNRDSMGHIVVGVADTWGDPDLMLYEGDTVSNRFDEDGVYPYACWIHPGMIGAIVVGDGVGTNVAAVVPAITTEAGDSSSTDGASAPIDPDGNISSTPWIIGALVLAGLAGAFVFVTRGRRKGAVAG